MLKLAKDLKRGDWIATFPHNVRVVDTAETRDGEIKVYHDFGNGGEPATSWYEANTTLPVY